MYAKPNSFPTVSQCLNFSGVIYSVTCKDNDEAENEYIQWAPKVSQIRNLLSNKVFNLSLPANSRKEGGDEGGEKTLFSCPTILTRRLAHQPFTMWQCQLNIIVTRRGWSTANVTNYVTFRWSFVGCIYCPNVTQSTLASRRSVSHKNEVFEKNQFAINETNCLIYFSYC